jgi:hypothetical protein
VEPDEFPNLPAKGVAVKTASFFLYTGPGRISIARFAPRGLPAGYRVYKPLAPGEWFNKVSEAAYRDLYFAQLADLSAEVVEADLINLAAGSEPVLLCYEKPVDIANGKTFCHRHMVAEWFKTQLGIDVPEVEAPAKLL